MERDLRLLRERDHGFICSVAAAVIGSAVVGAGVSVAGADKAAKTSQKNTNAQIAEERAQAEASAKRLDPFVQGGYQGNNALLTRLGVAAPSAMPSAGPNALSGGATGSSIPGVVGPATSAMPTNPAAPAGAATAPAGQPDFATYVKGNPDLAAAYQRDGGGRTIEQYGQDHWSGIGSTESRALTPFAAGSTMAPPAPTAPAAPAAPAADPNSPASLTGNAYSFGNSGNPTFEDKGFSYGATDYTASPAYAYTVDQSLKGALAGASATGALKSGAALKSLQDRASSLAYGDFDKERSFARAGFDTDRAFRYGAYGDQRNYLTGRADTQTANLFDLTKLGANAAAGVNQAGENATNGIVNALGTNATNKGNAAIAGANATTSLLGSGVSALAYQNALRPSLTSSVMQGVNANPGLF